MARNVKRGIGGNAATNAGGPACVKYGTTRDYIFGLVAVLPNGHLIQTGVKTCKGVVGYNMTRLIVGSEGTLGVITGQSARGKYYDQFQEKRSLAQTGPGQPQG